MKHKHEDLKIAAVRYYQSNETTFAQTAAIFGTSVRSLKRWIERFETEGSIKRPGRIVRAYKVKQIHVDCAIRKVHQHKQITMSRLLDMIKSEYADFSISRRHLNTIIRDQNLSRKRIRREHRPLMRRGSEIDHPAEVNAFFAELNRFDLDKIICLDETSMQVGMRSNYGRSKIGSRCRVRTTDNRVFQKHTLLGAVSTRGLERYELYQRGGMTSERFMQFLRSLLAGKRGLLILMDNAPVHRKRQIKTLIENSGNSLLYSLPYKPFLNPIESWFSQMKHHVKDMVPASFEGIRAAITTALTRINSESYLNIFRYAYRRNEFRIPNRRQSSSQMRKLYL